MYKIGLDLSMNSTGITIIKDDKMVKCCIIAPKLTKKQSECKYIDYYLYAKNMPDKNDNYTKKESLKTQNICNIVDIIENILFKTYKIQKSNSKVRIEGVAFGASGDVVGLSGLNYAVRYMLAKHNQQFEIISPTENKKVAVGNGGADKELMIDAFQRCTGFCNPLNVKIDDIADAYFLAMYND